MSSPCRTLKQEQRSRLEALERTVEEIEALKIIYNEDDDEGQSQSKSSSNTATTSFIVLSVEELQLAQMLIEQYLNGNEDEILSRVEGGGDGDDDDDAVAVATATADLVIPTLRVQLVLPIADLLESADSSHQNSYATVHFHLPPGYLLSGGDGDGDDDTDGSGNTTTSTPATVSIVSLGKFSRSKRSDLSKELNNKAMDFAASSSEALMLLIQELQDAILSMNEADATNTDMNAIVQDQDEDTTTRNSSSNQMNHQTSSSSSSSSSFSRRWIWVHHITKTSRINDIVREANDLSLSGYLKSGYPGVCVVEGTSHACDEFVQWIKGNKSRPGGFGRNWGHHVRGQIEIDGNMIDDRMDYNGDRDGDGNGNENVNGNRGATMTMMEGQRRGFVKTFLHIGEDLAELAGLCRDVGSWMEEEFLTYVMQH